MAITPSQWSHVLTIPESYTPSAATSGQTLVITESVIAKLSASDQTTFWSNVQNGGGDVRICESSDGTSQLPVEIVSLDNVAQTCVIWTRKASYDGTGDLYVFIGKAGETQPAVTDPFGRNAVWVDYEAVNHGVDYTNSTGNDDFTVFNAAPTSNPIKFGGGFDFSGVSGGLVASTSVTPSSPPVTLQSWFLTNFDTNRIHPVSVAGGGGYDYSIQAYNSTTGDGAEGNYPQNNTFGDSITTRAPQRWTEVTYAAYTVDASSNGSLLYKNDSHEYFLVSQALTIQDPYTLERVGIGYRADASPSYGSGTASEIRVRFGVLSENHLRTDYNNQNDPATFFGTPTLATTGGGGGTVTLDGATTIPSLTATGNASATLPQPSLSASINLTQLSATGSASATLPQPDASGSIVFNAPTATGSATATLPQPTLQAAITLPVVTANGDASATLPGFNLSASINIPTLTATGAAQATLPQPVVSASITMPSLTALGAIEATEPSFTVSGNVTLQPPTVTGSVSATLPQPSISGNIALPSIQASGFIIGGEVVITVELETNINEPQLSVNITEPKLSTNITE